MQRKKKSAVARRRNSSMTSRLGWLLTLGLVAVAAFTVYALETAWSRQPATVFTSTHRAESNSPAVLSTFAPTIPNATSAPVSAPQGMVWIPGGEFSMGSSVESDSLCSMPGMTRDASPIHRVYVDGFWMDATEL